MSGPGFFSDKHLQSFVMSVPFSEFVETGTSEGDTARWVAKRGRRVYTCEIDATLLPRFPLPPSVKSYAMNSPDFLLVVKLLAGDLPLIFLDAHWYGYWPLLDELRILATEYQSCVIIVHDCAVPGKPNFWACRGGGADQAGPVCEWDYIKPALSFERNQYRLFYPTYDDQTPGYLVLFQNHAPCGNLRDLVECPI